MSMVCVIGVSLSRGGCLVRSIGRGPCNRIATRARHGGPDHDSREDGSTVRAREPDTSGYVDREGVRVYYEVFGVRARLDRVRAGGLDRRQPDVEGAGRLSGTAPPGGGDRRAWQRRERPSAGQRALHRPGLRGRPDRRDGRLRDRPGGPGRAVRQRVVRPVRGGAAPGPRRRASWRSRPARTTGRRRPTAGSTPPRPGSPTSRTRRGGRSTTRPCGVATGRRSRATSSPRSATTRTAARSTRTWSAGPEAPPVR